MSEEKIVATLQELSDDEGAPGFAADKSTVSVQC